MLCHVNPGAKSLHSRAPTQRGFSWAAPDTVQCWVALKAANEQELSGLSAHLLNIYTYIFVGCLEGGFHCY